MNLVLVLTDRCNRSCSYCYADRSGAGEMTFEFAKRSIELAQRRSDTLLRIGFFGGEPLLRFPLLREIADYAWVTSERPLGFYLTTNGDALTDEVAEFFGAIDVDVSLSAHDEDPSTVRRAAARLIDVGIAPKGVLVATPENGGGLVARVEELLDAGIGIVAVSPNFYTPWPEEARERLEVAYRGLTELYLERQRAGRPFRLNLLDMRLDALRSGIPLRETKCELGPELLVVAPDGSLFPCDRMAVDSLCAGTRIGHVDEGVEEELWQRVAAASAGVPEGCRDCEHSLTCLGGCACVNTHHSGCAGEVPELVCWHERLAGRIAGELLPVAAPREPRPRRRRRLIRLTAGLLFAGGVTAACGKEQALPVDSPTEEPEPVTLEAAIGGPDFHGTITDAEGQLGYFTVRLQLRLSPEDQQYCCTEHEEAIRECLVRNFSKIPFSRLTLPEVEKAVGQELRRELQEIFGENAPLHGVRLEVLTEDEQRELLQHLQGYIGYTDE